MVIISVVSKYGSGGQCDARCYNATGTECHCVCGGAFHGVGARIAAEDRRLLSDDEILETASAVMGCDDLQMDWQNQTLFDQQLALFLGEDPQIDLQNHHMELFK